MLVEYLVSTTNRKEINFLDSLFQNIKEKDSSCVCINQCINIDLPEEIETSDFVHLVSVKEKGVSKSRNLAIKNASGDICVIADDDLVYLEDCEEKIKNIYKNDKDLDVAIFQIITPEGKPYKKYSSNSYLLRSPLKIMQVSSVEITFRRESILNAQILFNENLGLGADYTKGEEAFFIKDCLQKGLKIKYFPIPIVVHPIESSGKNFNEKNIIANGIVYKKLFPLMFLMVSFYFSIKKYKRYKQQSSFLKFLSLTLKGNWIGLTDKRFL